MVLKSVPFAVAIALVLAWGGIARADDYKPDEYLGLDLSKAVLSPKRLGPETQFAPVALEAKGGNEAQARAEPVDVPKKVAAERVRVPEPKIAQAKECAATRRSPHQARASPRQSAGRAGNGHPHPDLAVSFRRHLQLEALSVLLFTSPRLRGEVGIALAIRVRGYRSLGDLSCERGPSPNPLSASEARRARRTGRGARPSPHSTVIPASQNRRRGVKKP